MKKLLFLLASAAIAVSASAQDTIVFRDATEETAKVTSITENAVSYKQWDNLDGPEYTVNKSRVFYIKYQNGKKDVFGEQTTNYSNRAAFGASGSNALRSGSLSNADFRGIKFQSYVNVGAIFMESCGGPAVDVNFGARFGRYFYAGIETGFGCMIESVELFGQTLTFTEGYVPVAVNLKGYIPVGKRIYPYINCSLGGFVGVMDMAELNGFYCQVGAGIDIKRFSFGIGYSGLVIEGFPINCGYVKLGVRIGRW